MSLLFKLRCELNNMQEASSAFFRAKTFECKDKIQNAACYFEVLKSLDYTQKYKRLNTRCPSIHKLKTYQPIGCLSSLDELNKLTHAKHDDFGLYNHHVCIDYCITYHSYYYAIYPNEFQCICIKNLTVTNHETKNCKIPIFKSGRLGNLFKKKY